MSRIHYTTKPDLHTPLVHRQIEALSHQEYVPKPCLPFAASKSLEEDAAAAMPGSRLIQMRDHGGQAYQCTLPPADSKSSSEAMIISQGSSDAAALASSTGEQVRNPHAAALSHEQVLAWLHRAPNRVHTPVQLVCLSVGHLCIHVHPLWLMPLAALGQYWGTLPRMHTD